LEIILEYAQPELMFLLTKELEGHFLELAKDGIGSNIMEKIIVHTEPE